ncbi:related to purine nucleoside permease [Rhynchosporium secalis]|uniref:Related to purine nucleoside permease n=1 Tax=Rhynchosporium secalis TaxID=38038 RepID=A0A1E1MCP8_RHYSE|nr:related to purine nucleoside permease [Rhynchosporium secalis]
MATDAGLPTQAEKMCGSVGDDATKLITPRIFIITMFSQEATNWLAEDNAINFDKAIRVPGLSHGYEDVRFDAKKGVCLMTTGIALVNAALSISALTTSPIFDLTKTYFILSGIAGVNPKVATIGSVALAKLAVQVDIQLEFDAREVPESWGTGYLPIGAPTHGSFPSTFTGSEVFELNDNLRRIALSFAKTATLVDSEAAIANRVLYAGSVDGVFDAAALQKPCVVEGDVTASNMFWHGRHLAEGFEDLVNLYTNGHAKYCMTAMEDTAILAALLRAALQKRVDFSRIVLMRAGSNFDRGPKKDDVVSLPFVIDHGGFQPACRNLYLAGLEVVSGILESWDVFAAGIEADNYTGDIFGSLGGKPGFGPDAVMQ